MLFDAISIEKHMISLMRETIILKCKSTFKIYKKPICTVKM